MKKICVWGTSLRKIADEAQVIAFVRVIKSKFPDSQIVLFSQYGEFMTELMSKEGFEIETIRTLHLHKVMRAVASSDIFVFEGGPFFEDPLQAMRCLVLFSIAKIFRRPIIAYAATLFYFKTWWGRFLFRTMFEKMDAVTFRERIALRIVRDLGAKKEVALFSDPRFILGPAPSDEIRDILTDEGINVEEPFIGITTRYLHEDVPLWVKRSHHYTHESTQNSNEVIAKTLAYLADLAQLFLIPMHPSYNDDMATAESVKKFMKYSSRFNMLSRRYNALQIIGMISQCELLFACRLGSAVFATVTATPVIAVAYEPRMVDYMERLGYGQYVFDWKNLRYEELAARVREAWLSRNLIRNQMKSKANEFRELAWKNAEIMNEFM